MATSAHRCPPMSRKRTRKSPADYRFALFCVLSVELSALRAMLDDIHDDVPLIQSDNAYVLGELSRHNVVVALLPRAGNNFPGAIAVQLRVDFPSIQAGLLVGVAGGIPSHIGKHDIRLGDVVVSEATSSQEAVVQFDEGKNHDGIGLQRTGHCNKPPPLLSTTATSLHVRHIHNAKNEIPGLVSDMLRRYPNLATEFRRPSAEQDELFEPSYIHPGGNSCSNCDKTMLVKRRPRVSGTPQIHYGTIGSSNSLMRNAAERDRLAETHGILCVEMEAAALSDHIPCLVIKGVCDYADSHKNKIWQPYAAVTAAAYTKELLMAIPPVSSNDRQSTEIYPSLQTEDSIPADVSSKYEQRRFRYKLETLSQSLTFRRMDARLRSVSYPLTDTCTWLGAHPHFRDWKDSNGVDQHRGFLWIKGKPGSGKSTLMKSLLSSESEGSKTHKDVVSYFFDARASDTLAKSSLGLYRSLTHQIVTACHQAQDYFVKEFESKETDGEVEEWTGNELKAFLIKLTSSYLHRPLVILIDALDEGEESDMRQLVMFLEELSNTAYSSDTSLRICLSSRHFPHIIVKKGLSLVLENEKGHDADIDTYVRRTLYSDQGASMEDLYRKICEKSSGVFLWVVLVIPMINEGYAQGDALSVLVMSQRLTGLSDKIEDLFSEALARNTEDLEDCLALLQWVMYARKPLEMLQLYIAVGVESRSSKFRGDDHEPERIQRCILNTSRGLTEISKGESPVVRFIHETVPDFLRKSGLAKLDSRLATNTGAFSHERIKICCQKYLNEAVLDADMDVNNRNFRARKAQVLARYPLSEYAVKFMFVHADLAEDGGASQTQFLNQMSDACNLQQWVKFRNTFQQYKTDRYKANAPLLYILGDQGLGSLLRHLLDRGYEDAVTDEQYGTALQAACAMGHEQAARRLIAKSPNNVVKAGRLRHPLYAAIHGNHGPIIDLLIQEGLTPQVEDMERTLAVYVKAGNLPGTRALIQADPNRGGHVLCASSSRGKHDEVELLLTCGADANGRKGDEGTALQMAYDKGHMGIVTLLLTRGASLNFQGDGFPARALQTACYKGHADVVELLLAHGADVNAPKGIYGTALQAAYDGGHMDIMTLLLAHGADVNAQGDQADGEGDDAEAQDDEVEAQDGDVEAQDDNVEAQDDRAKAKMDDFGAKALQAACHWGYPGLVKLLVARGVDVNAPGGTYGTALQAACCNGHPGVVRLLLARGADVNAQSNNFLGTALQAACQEGRTGIVELLLAHGADTDAQGGRYGSALEAARAKGYTGIRELLLTHSAQTDPSGSLPSGAATRRRRR